MNTENGKISFGFKKLVTKPHQITKAVKNDSVELIDCLEGKEIKVKDPIIIPEKKPLIIPLRGNASDIVSKIEKESLKNKYIKKEIKSEVEDNSDIRPDSELTIEELAARQLVQEAKERLEKTTDTTKVHKLEINEEKESVDGKEPSLEDYENIPINDFGLALLRGMGWKEGMCIGKNQNNSLTPYEPDLRPKGLGLGAQKISLPGNEKSKKDTTGKELVLKRGAFVKIISGPHIGTCGEVQGLDEESGRVFVKSNSNNNGIISLNEAFVLPISKEDFNLASRVINNASFELYKKREKTEKNLDDSCLSRNESKPGKSGTSSSRKDDRSSKKIFKKKSKRRKHSDSSSDSTDTDSSKSKEKHKNSYSKYISESSEDDKVSNDKYRKDSKYHSKHHRFSNYTDRRHSSSHNKKSKKEKHIESNSKHKKYSKSKRYSSSETSSSSQEEKYYKKNR